MAKSAGSGGRAGRGRSISAGGVIFASMSNEQLVRYAATSGVTNVGQLSRTQASALRSAVKRGELSTYPSIWGDRPTYGPPYPRG